MSLQVTGTVGLARFQLRRDRILASLWGLVLLAVVYASASATNGLYPTDADRVEAARLINASPAAVALYGPILDVHSLGELAMTKTTVTYALFLMVLAMVLVRRHTRVEEESGRTELVSAGRVGRRAPLVSAVVESGVVVTIISALAGLCSVAGGLPAAGSLVFAASWWGSGMVGVGVAAVACQVSASARTCGAAGAAGLGVIFLLRAVGDVSESWLRWLSPLGWNTQLSAWSQPRWWVLLLYPVTAVALLVVALWLRDRRDLGAGLVAPRPGPAEGSPRLRDAGSLALRVYGPSLVGWSVAAAVCGVLFGSVVPSLGTLSDSATGQEMLRRLGGSGAVEDAMLAGIMSVVALILCGFTASVAAHAGSDEHDGRTEQVLATASPRGHTFTALLTLVLAATAWLLLVLGVAAAVGYGAQAGGFGDAAGRSLGAALAPLPAAWLLAALAILGLSLGDRWALLGWVLLAAFATVGIVGELLSLPDWVVGLSPFQHIAKVPSEPMAWGPAVVLTVLTAVVSAVAWWAYRRRDIG